MKKILYLSLILFAFNAEAQKGVIFKMKYLSNHTYDGTVNMRLSANVSLSGNDTIVAKLQEQGMTLPITLHFAMKMKGDIKTGSKSANGTFPLAMKYSFDDLSGDINGKSFPIPMDKLKTGVQMYAHIAPGGALRADSIAGQKLNDTSAQSVSKMMDMVQKSIKFPDHPMRVGESFTQDMPLSIPVAGNMKIDSKVVYKLVNIADGKAYFDIQQTMDMRIPIQGDAINLSGSGAGKMVYSIKDSFATAYSTDMNLKFIGTIKTLKIDASAKMVMEYNYTVN
jgi:hypothetical protein